MVSLDYNFVLIRVPKTGSESQAQLYMNYGTEIRGDDDSANYPTHITSAELKNIFREKKNDNHRSAGDHWDWDRCFKFGFVRNPWEREVSFYSYYKKHPNGVYRKHKDMSFSEYLEIQSGVPGGGWEMHTFLTDVDYVARYENFEEETDFIWKKLNLPIGDVSGRHKLEKHNATEHKPYWEYYNDKEILLVQETYKKDIELYSYEFGN